MTAGGIDIPGFADPVGESQATFRAVLDAMARPGRIAGVGAGIRPPIPLDQATAAVALTLLDQETRVFLDPTISPAGPWLGFHVGAPLAVDTADADFVIARSCPELATLRVGSDDAPQDSTTLILQIEALGHGSAFRLSGPGIADAAVFHAHGLSKRFVAMWRSNHALFPRGIDIVLCAGDRVAALPRSVMLETI